MPVKRMKFITRDYVRQNPDTMFLFGDNMARRGFGGQAREMRGEPNAIGIPTKWMPCNAPDAFFSDDDFEKVKGHIDKGFCLAVAHLIKEGIVVVPEDGLGTGLARLQETAPRLAAHIDWWIGKLEEFS